MAVCNCCNHCRTRYTNLREQFKDALANLFDRRRDWLAAELYRSSGLPRHGRPREFRRTHVYATLDELLELIVMAPPVWRMVADEFDYRYSKYYTFHTRRFRGHDAKRPAMRDWWWNTLELPDNAVYVYRDGFQELNAGSTINGASRASEQFETYRGWSARFVDAYLPRTKRNLVSLECLAIHRYSPKYNKVRAGRRAGAFEECPVCYAATTSLTRFFRHSIWLDR